MLYERKLCNLIALLWNFEYNESSMLCKQIKSNHHWLRSNNNNDYLEQQQIKRWKMQKYKLVK